MRHCKTLLRKHVLPKLFKPQPVVEVAGQDVSIGRVHRDLSAPDGVCGVGRDDDGEEGDEEGGARASGVVWGSNINTMKPTTE